MNVKSVKRVKSYKNMVRTEGGNCEEMGKNQFSDERCFNDLETDIQLTEINFVKQTLKLNDPKNG